MIPGLSHRRVVSVVQNAATVLRAAGSQILETSSARNGKSSFAKAKPGKLFLVLFKMSILWTFMDHNGCFIDIHGQSLVKPFELEMVTDVQ